MVFALASARRACAVRHNQAYSQALGQRVQACPTQLLRIKRPLHLALPGLFNDSWIYLNGRLRAARLQKPAWYDNDYHFGWDVDAAGELHEVDNWITLRIRIPHHMAGLFRRPFLYRVSGV